MTRLDLRSEVRRLIKDLATDSSRQRYSDTTLNTRLDLIHKEMCGITGCSETSSDINITAGTSTYAMTATMLKVNRVNVKQSSGEWLSIPKRTMEELDMLKATWQEDTGDPAQCWYLYKSTSLGLYPEPSVSRTSGLRVFFAQVPADWTTDADIPFGGDYQFYAFHRYIAFGVATLCKLDEGDGNMAGAYETEYATGIKLLTRQVNQSQEQTRRASLYESARPQPRRTK